MSTRAPRSAPRTRVRREITLLNGDNSADWNFSKEFSRRFAWQTNAAVGGGVVRHDALVHSEIETAQPHEIRHINVINGRAVIAFFVSDDEIATLSGIAFPTGRTR